MNIVSSLKSIPVTQAYRCIITAWNDQEAGSFERRPFRVYLPCGAEGFAIGDPDQLSELMDAQCEGRWIEDIQFKSEDGQECGWEGICVIADEIRLGVRIEAVHEYINHRLTRREMVRSAKAFEQSL